MCMSNYDDKQDDDNLLRTEYIHNLLTKLSIASSSDDLGRSNDTLTVFGIRRSLARIYAFHQILLWFE